MSLFESLTKVDQAYPATELIRSLLKVVAYDACAVKRNTLSSYRIVTKARDRCKEIHDLIKAVDEEENADAWAIYDQYTKAIDPLEELLFEIAALVDKESRLFLNQHLSISEAIAFVSDWQTSRTELQTFSRKLQTTPSETSEIDLSLQQHDDRCLISAICDDIVAHTFIGPPSEVRGGRTPVIQLKDVAGQILSRLSDKTNDSSMTLAVQCTMIVQGVMHVAEHTTETEAKVHLSVAKVWQKALSLLKNLGSHLSDGMSSTLATTQTEYEEFLKFLQTLTAEVPSQYLELKKSVKSVKRPYHARTLALASQCRALVEHFNKDRKATSLPPLTIALEAAMEALEAAASAMDTLFEFKEEDIATTDAGKAFDSAEDKVGACFTTYELTSDWAEQASKMAAALEQDKKRVSQMKARLSGASGAKFNDPLASEPSARVTVNIQKEGDEAGTPHVTDEATTLNALMWKVILNEGTDIHQWRFEQDSINDPKTREQVGFYKQVKDIRIDAPLYLVRIGASLPAPEPEPKAEAETEAEKEAESEPQLQTGAGAGAGAGAEAGVEAEAEAESGSTSGSETESGSPSESDLRSDSESEIV